VLGCNKGVWSLQYVPHLRPEPQHVTIQNYELFRSTFQSSNPIGQYIVQNYMHQPKLTPNPTLINPNLSNQIKALKRTSVL